MGDDDDDEREREGGGGDEEIKFTASIQKQGQNTEKAQKTKQQQKQKTHSIAYFSQTIQNMHTFSICLYRSLLQKGVYRQQWFIICGSQARFRGE